MNRRDFLKRGATAAVVAGAVIPIANKPGIDSFPDTEEAMKKVIKEKGPAKYRPEVSMIPKGLSATITPMATFWYYSEGDRVAVLRESQNDKRTRFYVERHEKSKPIYYPAMNNGKDI